ncbi:MAG: glycoside hydrolase family 38 C-terminal domain-containing protein, partial [Candidatus Saccharicenans sp.]|nr:glycoside hydrolase family 38 C-terminal domain-containing protein [Candidatus Saccharicenans sp.]
AGQIRVFGPAGQEVASQILETNGKKVKLIFLAKVPSVGFSVYEIRPSEEPCRLNTGLKVSSNTLENNRYLVKINRDGEVSSIFDKGANREILASAARLSFHHERPQQWPAWNMDWEDRMKPPIGYVEGPARINVVENGPARVAVRIERESRGSKFIQVVRLAAGGAADRLEFYNQIDWATPESSLKAVFPLTVSNPLATYNWGVGTIQRANNDPKKFEVPSHLWFDLTDRSGKYGVSILEDCKYGSDKPSDNILRLTLLFTPGVRSWPKEQATQDFGRHEILYALYGHQGDWRQANSRRQALRLNQPLLAFQTVPHEGSLGKSFSFLRTSHDNLAISALKKAENSDEVIVRLVETKGQNLKKASLTFFGGISSAREVNGVEEEIGPAEVKEGNLIFDLSRYSLRTFAVKLNPSNSTLNLPESVPLELPYNLDIFSFDEHRTDGSFDQDGRTYPAEWLPGTIIADSISFKLGPKPEGEKNALSCRGQVIKIPEGNFNRLYLLAAASEEGQTGIFKVGPRQVEIPVAFWSGFIGQWDNRIWAEGPAAKIDFDRENFTYVGVVPGYTKHDNVALFTTHLHHPNEGNEPYIYGYIFKYSFEIPRGVKEIVLPNNPSIAILAMTLASDDNSLSQPVQKLFDHLERSQEGYERFAVVPRPVISPARSYVSPSEPARVSIEVELEGAEIHYTLDGSEPTEKSPVYNEPLSISGNAVLKAGAFHPKRLPSPIAVAFYSHSFPVADIIYFSPPSPSRTGAAGEKTLIDLVRGRLDLRDSNWQGFEENDLEVVLDLGQKRRLYELELSCCENHNSRVFLPSGIMAEVSLDGRKFEVVAEKELDIPQPTGIQRPALKSIFLGLKGQEARFIRVKAINLGVVPDGFRNAGQKAWMLFDEIYVR